MFGSGFPDCHGNWWLYYVCFERVFPSLESLKAKISQLEVDFHILSSVRVQIGIAFSFQFPDIIFMLIGWTYRIIKMLVVFLFMTVNTVRCWSLPGRFLEAWFMCSNMNMTVKTCCLSLPMEDNKSKFSHQHLLLISHLRQYLRVNAYHIVFWQ